MWSSKPLLLALALVAPLLLAGCSGLRPVYGTGGVVGDRLELSYAERMALSGQARITRSRSTSSATASGRTCPKP